MHFWNKVVTTSLFIVEITNCGELIFPRKAYSKINPRTHNRSKFLNSFFSYININRYLIKRTFPKSSLEIPRNLKQIYLCPPDGLLFLLVILQICTFRQNLCFEYDKSLRVYVNLFKFG